MPKTYILVIYRKDEEEEFDSKEEAEERQEYLERVQECKCDMYEQEVDDEES